MLKNPKFEILNLKLFNFSIWTKINNSPIGEFFCDFNFEFDLNF